jgi:hypothetical protein
LLVFNLDGWYALSLVAQIVLPLLVNLVTTRVTVPRDKVLLLAGLTLITTGVTGALHAHDTGTVYDLGKGLLDGLGGFVLSIAAYNGWKLTGLTEKAKDALFTSPDPELTPPPGASTAPAVVTPITTARSYTA